MEVLLPELVLLSQQVGKRYTENNKRLVCAESCTAGGVAYALTMIPGSSTYVERGFVTYSNEAKVEQLGVEATLIAEHGAVSQTVAKAMAQGAFAHSYADVAIAVTGIAGPGGAAPQKPVGLVWFAIADNTTVIAQQQVFAGDRAAVRAQAIENALLMLKSF